MRRRPPARSVEEVAELYRRWGTHHYDEELSQLEHAEQTAALAVAAGASDELVVAALLHDVGHLLHLASEGGRYTPATEDLAHEELGARYLSALFGPAVTAPVALHVRAKRYRCAVDPAYLGALSEGSRRSLALQGGPADPEEVRAFAANPRHRDAVDLRGWDDGAKRDDVTVEPFEAHLPRLERVAARSAGRGA
jgi:phosphonate degradation associated HDIG domain protein